MSRNRSKTDTRLENQQRINAAVVTLKRALSAAQEGQLKGKVTITVPYKDGILGDVCFEKTDYLSGLD
ncbi:MAG: hypothetical protein AAF589_03455 [Planctomycetota bacterium]